MLQRLKNRRITDEGGFTLIELLVVIIILGILAAVVVFAVGGIGDKGEKSACKIDTRTLRTAEEAYAGSAVGGGNYADESTLKTAGFLSDLSTYHEVVVGDPPNTFVINVSDPKCGAEGFPVDGTSNF